MQSYNKKSLGNKIWNDKYFFGKIIIKYCGEAGPRPFCEKSKLSTSLDQQSEMLKFAFVVCPSTDLLKYVKAKLHTTYFYLTAFLKTKRVLGLISLPHFLDNFFKKI